MCSLTCLTCPRTSSRVSTRRSWRSACSEACQSSPLNRWTQMTSRLRRTKMMMTMTNCKLHIIYWPTAVHCWLATLTPCRIWRAYSRHGSRDEEIRAPHLKLPKTVPIFKLIASLFTARGPKFSLEKSTVHLDTYGITLLDNTDEDLFNSIRHSTVCTTCYLLFALCK